jgi:hypothetical protein
MSLDGCGRITREARRASTSRSRSSDHLREECERASLETRSKHLRTRRSDGASANIRRRTEHGFTPNARAGDTGRPSWRPSAKGSPPRRKRTATRGGPLGSAEPLGSVVSDGFTRDRTRRDDGPVPSEALARFTPERMRWTAGRRCGCGMAHPHAGRRTMGDVHRRSDHRLRQRSAIDTDPARPRPETCASEAIHALVHLRARARRARARRPTIAEYPEGITPRADGPVAQGQTRWRFTHALVATSKDHLRPCREGRSSPERAPAMDHLRGSGSLEGNQKDCAGAPPELQSRKSERDVSPWGSLDLAKAVLVPLPRS